MLNYPKPSNPKHPDALTQHQPCLCLTQAAPGAKPARLDATRLYNASAAGLEVMPARQADSHWSYIADHAQQLWQDAISMMLDLALFATFEHHGGPSLGCTAA